MMTYLPPLEDMENLVPAVKAGEPHLLIVVDDHSVNRLVHGALILRELPPGSEKKDIDPVSDTAEKVNTKILGILRDHTGMPAVILMDQLLGSALGTDVYKLFRQTREALSVIFIFISATPDEILEKIGEDAAVSILSKPIDVEVLRRVIAEPTRPLRTLPVKKVGDFEAWVARESQDLTCYAKPESAFPSYIEYLHATVASFESRDPIHVAASIVQLMDMIPGMVQYLRDYFFIQYPEHEARPQLHLAIGGLAAVYSRLEEMGFPGIMNTESFDFKPYYEELGNLLLAIRHQIPLFSLDVQKFEDATLSDYISRLSGSFVYESRVFIKVDRRVAKTRLSGEALSSIDRIIRNLAYNALTPDVEANNVEIIFAGDGRNLSIAVSDDGKLFRRPPSLCPQMARQEVSKGKYSGHGIQDAVLAAEALCGKISFYQRGRGQKLFTVTLPLKEAVRQAA